MVPDRIGRRRRQELSLLRDRSTRSRRVVLLQQTHDVGRHVDLQGVAGGLGRGRRRLNEKRNRKRRRKHGGENRLHHSSLPDELDREDALAHRRTRSETPRWGRTETTETHPTTQPTPK